MASPNKIKLFETVAQLHNQGKVKLSSDERNRIESETQELIRRSVQNKMAAKAPEGFDKLLSGLQDADPDDAYTKIVDFMEEEGLLEKEIALEDEENEDKEEKTEKKEMDKLEDVEDDLEDLVKKDEEVHESLGDKGEDKGKPDFSKEKKPEKKEDEFDKAKKEIMAQVKDLEKDLDEDSPKKKLMPDMKKDDKKVDDKKKDIPSIKDLQKDKRDKFKEPSKEEMGLEENDSMVKARKIKVALTKSKNIIALHADRGPLFHAVPNDAVKSDPDALRKAVNKVRAAILYEGVKKAASRCGARLLVADVDDDILLAYDHEVSPVSKGVTEGDDTDTQKGNESEETNPLKDNDTDTREKPDTGEMVLARRRRSDVLEGGDTETRDQPEKPASDVTDESDTDTMEDHETPDPETMDGADTDYRELQANYSKLYKARAEKMAKKANEQFVDKLNRCIRIASARMLINDYRNPFKEAAFDVLTADDVALSNGDYFNPMDAGTAVEVIELIASESHDNFVRHLLSKATDLMEKSDEYLKDAEGDTKDRSPKMMAVDSEKKASARPDNRLRRAAAAGNMNFEIKGVSEAPKHNSVREMVHASTKVGRTLDQYHRAGVKK